MKYNKPITYNTNPITSSRPLRKLGRNLFFSLGVPVEFTLIALDLSSIAQNYMFIVAGDTLGCVKKYYDIHQNYDINSTCCSCIKL